MSVSGFLLDTCVISELIKPRPAGSVVRWVDATDERILFLSVLTLGEIRKGIDRLPAGAKRTRLETWLSTSLLDRFSGRILDIDQGIADRWGQLSARPAKTMPQVPVIDGLIAATAIHHNLTLVTRNTRDTTRTGATVFDPWKDL